MGQLRQHGCMDYTTVVAATGDRCGVTQQVVGVGSGRRVQVDRHLQTYTGGGTRLMLGVMVGHQPPRLQTCLQLQGAGRAVRQPPAVLVSFDHAPFPLAPFAGRWASSTRPC